MKRTRCVRIMALCGVYLFLFGAFSPAAGGRDITVSIVNFASGGTVVTNNGSIIVNVEVTGATEVWVYVYDANGFLQNWGSTNCVNGVGQVLVPTPEGDGYRVEAEIWKFGECYDTDVKDNINVINP